jgi:hypothetical protein
VADSTGLYYETADGPSSSGNLAFASPSGSTTTSSDPFTADSPLWLSGGELIADTVQADKTVFQAWDPTTLRLVASYAGGPTGSVEIASTDSGLIGATNPAGPPAPNAEIGRLDVASGTFSGTVEFSSNISWLLEGPYPAVLNSIGGMLYLVRLT